MTQRSLLVSTFVVLAMAGAVMLFIKGLLYLLGVLAVIVALSFLVEHICWLADEETDKENLRRLECITDHLQRELCGLTEPTDEKVKSVVRRHVRTALFE